MDDDSLNMKNWGYYEQPPLKGLGLQLMSSVAERDTKPPSFLSGREHPVSYAAPNGAFHTRDCIVTEPPITQIEYVRDTWINNTFRHILPGHHYNPAFAESSGTHQHMQMIPPPDTAKDLKSKEISKEPTAKKEGAGPAKKRSAGAAATPKPPKSKKARKGSAAADENGNGNPPAAQRAKTVKKNIDFVINGVDMDLSGIPIPVCSCTGSPQQCYRWGCGGWQSACCTTTISMYPLPMSTKRRGARIAGRKMSQGAFKKVLEKLASEGYNFADPIDLRNFWAKHGTNKFVTIR